MFSSQGFALRLLTLSILLFAVSGTASGETCKGKMTAKYNNADKTKATDAAIVQWSNNARRSYGAEYANWSKAQDGKVNCKAVFRKNQQTYNCIASGKPCAD